MNRLRSLGIALVYLGLSCRKAAEVLRFSDDASYEAVREWYHKAKVLLRAPPKRCRKEIAIDETKIKEGEGDVVLPLGGGRYGERGSARRGVELTLTRDGRARRVSLHQTRITGVHEHADGAGGRRAVVFLGVKQDGRAVGLGDVRETERGRAVVFSLQAEGETVLPAVAA